MLPGLHQECAVLDGAGRNDGLGALGDGPAQIELSAGGHADGKSGRQPEASEDPRRASPHQNADATAMTNAAMINPRLTARAP